MQEPEEDDNDGDRAKGEVIVDDEDSAEKTSDGEENKFEETDDNETVTAEESNEEQETASENDKRQETEATKDFKKDSVDKLSEDIEIEDGKSRSAEGEVFVDGSPPDVSAFNEGPQPERCKSYSMDQDYEEEYGEYGEYGEYVANGRLYCGESQQEHARSEEEPETKEEKDEGEEQSSTSSMSNVYSNLSPYFIKWSFGLKTGTKLINLTKDNQFEVFYATTHFGVIYDYRKNSMVFLPGHNSIISSIAADASGRWLVTADEGEDNVIIIWDHDRRVPCWTLYNIFSDRGNRFVQISQDARYLAAVSGGPRQTCKFFLWTYGRDEADGEFELDPSDGSAVHIQFNHLDTNQFVITMEKEVMFCKWISEKKTVDNFVLRTRKRKLKTGTFKESLFLDDDHTAITSTSTGHIVIWCDVLYLNDEAKQMPGTILKKYMKSIKIHKSAVTSLQLADQIVVISSEEGVISFHDQNLHLLYWVPKYMFEAVACVSCNLTQQQGDQLDPFSDEFDDLLSSKRSTSEEDIQDLIHEGYWDKDEISSRTSDDKNEAQWDAKTIEFAEDTKREKNMRVPSDCTIEMRPFYARDFVFLNYNGKFGYVSHFRTKVRYFLCKCEAPVLSVDCNPNKAHLAVGNAVGRVDLYEHKYKKLLASNTVANTGIAYLKYSPSGRYLMTGLGNGAILFLDPLLLTVNNKIQNGKTAIIKMCFSSNEMFLSCFDKDDIVYLYKKKKAQKWTFMGAHKSHYKKVKDIMFDEEYDKDEKDRVPRLFTIGEDRMLVEYDTKNLVPNRLQLKSIDRIEQTALPECFIIMPTFGKKVCFMISNDEYKLKIIERDTRICCKTTVGPTADTPLNFMRVIPHSKSLNEAKMICATQKHIGLRFLPPTGNPFEGIGMVAHPLAITGIAISHDFKHIFTIGSNDCSVLMWKINSKSLDISRQLGGSGIEPFTSLIEGGTNGFLFKEFEDFFYYSQIIHQGEHANINRSVSRKLALCEIPDMVRSLGYYPTEYEVENIMYEVRHLEYESTGKLIDEITFEECVKIFVNHRPARGISLECIKKALLSVANLSDPECIVIEKEELYKALEERAEAMSREEVIGYLCVLLLPKNERDPIPDRMTLKDFAEDVLGIDLTLTS